MSEDLTDEEQVERLKNWWTENGVFFVSALVAGILAVTGWNYYGSYQNEAGEKSSQSFRDYLELESDQRSMAANKLAEDFGGSTVHFLALLDQAEKEVSADNIADAEILLNRSVNISESDLLADMALIRLAKVQFQLEKSKEALLTIDKVKSKGYVSFALELKGDMHSDLGDIEKAYQSYEAALSELDESAERPLLQLKLDNAAPFNGKFVRSETELSQAVREAEELLRSKETDDQPSN